MYIYIYVYTYVGKPYDEMILKVEKSINTKSLKGTKKRKLNSDGNAQKGSLCIYVYIHIYMYIYICDILMCVYLYVCMYVCMYVFGRCEALYAMRTAA